MFHFNNNEDTVATFLICCVMLCLLIVVFFKVFSDFSNRDGLLRVARNITMVSFSNRKHVFREGEPGHHFYIVLDGEISIVKV